MSLTESPEATCCGHVQAVHETVVVSESGSARFAIDFFEDVPWELLRAWREGRVFEWCGVCEDTCGPARGAQCP